MQTEPTQTSTFRYGSVFAAEEVDLSALLLMTEVDLADLGLTKGARVKVRAALAALNDAES